MRKCPLKRILRCLTWSGRPDYGRKNSERTCESPEHLPCNACDAGSARAATRGIASIFCGQSTTTVLAERSRLRHWRGLCGVVFTIFIQEQQVPQRQLDNGPVIALGTRPPITLSITLRSRLDDSRAMMRVCLSKISSKAASSMLTLFSLCLCVRM